MDTTGDGWGVLLAAHSRFDRAPALERLDRAQNALPLRPCSSGTGALCLWFGLAWLIGLIFHSEIVGGVGFFVAILSADLVAARTRLFPTWVLYVSHLALPPPLICIDDAPNSSI